MKKLTFWLLTFIVLGSTPAYCQLSPKVDERFELTSIAFRLAGAPEYSQCGVPSYADDIDAYFSKYRNHPLITYIQ